MRNPTPLEKKVDNFCTIAFNGCLATYITLITSPLVYPILASNPEPETFEKIGKIAFIAAGSVAASIGLPTVLTQYAIHLRRSGSATCNPLLD
ncbi:MAG: hypothetical protein AABW88_04745 [Nanoarchaeota archaeon]